MKWRRQRTNMHELSIRRVILIGICMAALGVLFDLQLERNSFHTTGSTKEFFFLEYTFFPLLLLGLLVTIAGSMIWAWRTTSILSLASIGVVLILSSLLAANLVPINIHGWTASLVFVFVGSSLIGVLFVVLAFVRFASSRFGLRRKQG
jgi:hypothetical protein